MAEPIPLRPGHGLHPRLLRRPPRQHGLGHRHHHAQHLAHPSEAPWGTTHDDSSGDFNLFRRTTGEADQATLGTNFFQLTTNGFAGDSMSLTEFSPATSPAVPEPAAMAPFAVGGPELLGLLMRARRRARSLAHELS